MGRRNYFQIFDFAEDTYLERFFLLQTSLEERSCSQFYTFEKDGKKFVKLFEQLFACG